MSQALRKLTANIKIQHSTYFHQPDSYEDCVMFGSPETTMATLKSLFFCKNDIRRIGAIKQGDEIIGNETRESCKK